MNAKTLLTSAAISTALLCACGGSSTDPEPEQTALGVGPIISDPPPAAGHALWPISRPPTEPNLSHGQLYVNRSGVNVHHAGEDIGGGGETIVAVNDGEFVKVPMGTHARSVTNHALGNAFYVMHDDGTVTMCAHVASYLRENGRVRRGEPLALSGATGGDYLPHAHCERKVLPVLGNTSDHGAAEGAAWGGYKPDAIVARGNMSPHISLMNWLDPAVFRERAVTAAHGLVVEAIATTVWSNPGRTETGWSVPAMSKWIALSQAPGGWYLVYLPSPFGPAAAWIAASPASGPQPIGTVQDDAREHGGVGLWATPSYSGTALESANAYDDQKFVVLEQRAAGGGCNRPWFRIPLVQGQGSSAWICGDRFNAVAETPPVVPPVVPPPVVSPPVQSTPVISGLRWVYGSTVDVGGTVCLEVAVTAPPSSSIRSIEFWVGDATGDLQGANWSMASGAFFQPGTTPITHQVRQLCHTVSRSGLFLGGAHATFSDGSCRTERGHACGSSASVPLAGYSYPLPFTVNSSGGTPPTAPADWAGRPSIFQFQVNPSATVRRGEHFCINAAFAATATNPVVRASSWATAADTPDPYAVWFQFGQEAHYTGLIGDWAGVCGSLSTKGRYWFGVHLVTADGRCTTERGYDCMDKTYTPRSGYILPTLITVVD